jgi:signal transduction histidine kinase
MRSRALLPTTLTRELGIDSILAVEVRDPSGAVVYASKAGVDARFAAVDSIEEQPTRLRFEVSIHPAVAGRLIIGGLPSSRLPEVLATAFVAVSPPRPAPLSVPPPGGAGSSARRLRVRRLPRAANAARADPPPRRAPSPRKGAHREQKDRSLRIIDEEARRLSFLVDSILSFTHSEPGRLSPVSTDVAVEIDEIVSGFEPLAQAQGVRLTTRLESGIVADIDRGALRQVLLNLLDNAVRYGPPGQNVTITTASAGDTWTLEVADEGRGIPADERERIFAPYYRMKRDAAARSAGPASASPSFAGW